MEYMEEMEDLRESYEGELQGELQNMRGSYRIKGFFLSLASLAVGFCAGLIVDISYTRPISVYTVNRDSKLDIVVGTRQYDKRYQFIQQRDGGYIELSKMVESERELERKKLEEKMEEFEKSFEIK